MYSAEFIAEVRKKRYTGASIRELARDFSISRATASAWMVGVEVSEEGKKRLARNGSIGASLMNSEEAIRKKFPQRERGYNKGLASTVTMLDALCVGMYWGEGSKKERKFAFSNSELETIRLMRDWLVRAGQPAEDIKATVQVHPEDNITDTYIRDFWCEAGIQGDNIKIYKFRSSASKRLVRTRLLCGTCRLALKKLVACITTNIFGDRETEWRE